MKKKILFMVALLIGASFVQAEDINPISTEAVGKVVKLKKKDASKVEAPTEVVQNEVKVEVSKKEQFQPSLKVEVKQEIIDPQTIIDNEAIRGLFSSLSESVNSGNSEKFKTAVRDNLIVITSDQEFLMSKSGVAEYFSKSVGESGKFERTGYIIDPGVTVELNKSGSWAAVYGKGIEKYRFNDSEYDLPIRWTAVVVKEDNIWKIHSFHSGISFSKNPILTAFEELSTKATIFGGIAGLLLGFLLGLLIGRASKKV